ncbi:MAG: DNA translocase FtsK [Oscillospiraceae bacterium]|nr:DNA translocase FtsK [Oscillospiraceae bacterium]
MIDRDETPQKLMQRSMNVFTVTTFLSGFIEIMFGGGRLQEATFKDSMQMLYEEGINWSGGGMVSIVAMPLQKLLGDVGSKITICLLLFVSIMIMSRKGVSDIFDFFATPFRRMKELYEEDQENAGLLDDFETEVEEERIREERALAEQAEEAEALDLVKKPRSRKSKKTQEPQFLSDLSGSIDVPMADPAAMALDIPVFDATIDPVPDANMVITDYTDMTDPAPLSEPMPDPADEDLEALIRQATEKPEKSDKLKKKTKEEEKLDAMQEIADEVALQQAGSTPEHPYQMPPMDFLKKGKSHANDPGAAQELREKADLLQQVMESFNVEARITNIARGPSVTRYEVQPAAGVKVSKITNLSNDIALNFAVEGVRIEAPIPGKPAVGIEVPNTHRDMVSLRELLESPQFAGSKSKLAFGIGKDIAGNVIIGDIAKMPHMIIAGATGSGKSVCTNSIIMSILYHANPDEVKLILIDPKIVEFRVYDGIPHLLIPVVTDPKKAAGALNWAVQEMLKRYDIFAQNGVRNLAEFNEMCEDEPEMEKMPQILIVIDELAELMMTASKEVEDAICRLAQLARAAGMHLIIATQRPTTNIITGLIKANIPSRIALYVKSQIDSRVILDVGGAEKLLGNGDMLYLPNGQPKPVRIQGCYVSTAEIEKVVNFIKSQSESEYDENIIAAVDELTVNTPEEKQAAADSEAAEDFELDKDADIIEQAIELVVNVGQASTSNLQRRLRLGYGRAASVMDKLEQMGIIGPYEGAKPRKVLLTKEQLNERKLRNMK